MPAHSPNALQTAAAELFERILAAPHALVAVEHPTGDQVIEQFRGLARHGGQALYLWRPQDGLCSLRDSQAQVPAAGRFADLLRHVRQSLHFGVYLLQGLPASLAEVELAALRKLAQAPAPPLRRIVLLDAPGSLLARLDGALSRVESRPRVVAAPRLRDGRWLITR